MTSEGTEFGCEHCWPSDADAAWEARRGLEHVAELIDESHFHVMILDCPNCAQRFVSIFTEMIDWRGGDDPQEWTLLPINDADADDLIQKREALTKTKLEALGGFKRCLRRDHPSGTEPRNLWIVGFTLGWHD